MPAPALHASRMERGEAASRRSARLGCCRALHAINKPNQIKLNWRVHRICQNGIPTNPVVVPFHFHLSRPPPPPPMPPGYGVRSRGSFAHPSAIAADGPPSVAQPRPAAGRAASLSISGGCDTSLPKSCERAASVLPGGRTKLAKGRVPADVHPLTRAAPSGRS